MWSPTHVQITVLKAKNLVRKAKNAACSSFVTIQLGKDKFQTTVLENTSDPEWEEECDLIYKEPDGNIILNVFHRSFFGLDEFLGQVVLPLSEYDIYDSPKTRWHFLSNKPGKKDDRERGELEVRLVFVVRDNSISLQETKKSLSGSFMDVASAVGQKIQKLPTRSISLKLDRLDSRLRLDRFKSRRSSPSADDNSSDISIGSSGTGDFHRTTRDEQPKSLRHRSMSLSRLQEPRSMWSNSRDTDSAFIDEDLPAITESPAKHKNENFPKSKRQRSNSSSFTKLSNLVENSMKRTISVPGSTDLSLTTNRGLHLSVSAEEWNEVCNKQNNIGDYSDLNSPMDDRPVPRERKSRLRRLRNNGRRHTIQEVELPDSLLEENGNMLSITDNRMTNQNNYMFQKIPQEIVDQYEMMNHRELLGMVLSQQEMLQLQEDKIRDLELYIDNLLVRVMETQPRILQNPYKAPNPAFYR